MLKHAVVLIGLLSFGCGGSGGANQRIVKTASARWQCPADEIEVKKLSGDMYRVAGCDREADYACPKDSGGQCLRVSGT